MRSITNKNKLSFGLLGRNDINAFNSMVLSLYKEDPPGRKMSARKIQRTISELTAHPSRGSIIMIHAETEVVGYAIIIHYWSNEYGGNIACIDELYIKPRWRKRGVGSKCIDYISRRSGTKFKGMQTETTPKNRRAMLFYGNCGFRSARNQYLFREL